MDLFRHRSNGDDKIMEGSKGCQKTSETEVAPKGPCNAVSY